MTTKFWWQIAVLSLAACGGSSSSDDRSDGGGIPGAEGDGSGGADGGDAADGDDGNSGAVSADGTAGDDAADEGGVDDGTPKFDVATMPDITPEAGCGGAGEVDFSYVWVANSTQSTVSKINTQTLVEEGRYYTRDDAAGNPSRTSVNLSGDVATANRNGGLTKFYARTDNCVDLNANGVIDTSTGAADIRAWADEECRAWYTPFGYTSHRPVAWSQGEYNPTTCQQDNQKVWTTGVINNATIEVNLVNGDTGVVEDSVMVPEINPSFFGFYGGAVDAEGNFWVGMLGGPNIGRFSIADLSDYQLWPQQHGGYGLTVGASGYVFTCTNVIGRFDPATETWTSVTTNGSSGGCMEDANGILWSANGYGVQPIIGVDVNTMTVVHEYTIPEHAHGISIDFEGYVWAVGMSTSAYRVDPATGLYDTVTGLVNPYTYSDMTGFALSSVGGGPPTG